MPDLRTERWKAERAARVAAARAELEPVYQALIVQPLPAALRGVLIEFAAQTYKRESSAQQFIQDVDRAVVSEWVLGPKSRDWFYVRFRCHKRKPLVKVLDAYYAVVTYYRELQEIEP